MKVVVVFVVVLFSVRTEQLQYDECIAGRNPGLGMTSDLEKNVVELETEDDVSLHSWTDCVQLCCAHVDSKSC